MKFKKLILITFLLVAMLGISMVSASPDADSLSDVNIVSEPIDDIDLVLDDDESSGVNPESFNAYINEDETDISKINETVGVSFYCPENITGEIIICIDEEGFDEINHKIQESEWNTTVNYTMADLGISAGGNYYTWMSYKFEGDTDDMWLNEGDIKVIDSSKFRVDLVSEYGWPQGLDENTYFYLYYPEGNAGKTAHVNTKIRDGDEIKDFSVAIPDNSSGFINWTLTDLGMMDREIYVINVSVGSDFEYCDEFIIEIPVSTAEIIYINDPEGDEYVAFITLSPKITEGQVTISINGTESFNKALSDITDTDEIGGGPNKGRIDYMISADDLNPALDEGTYDVEVTFVTGNYTVSEKTRLEVVKANVVKDNGTNISIVIYNNDVVMGDWFCIARIVTPLNTTGNVAVYVNGSESFNKALSEWDDFEETENYMIYYIDGENFQFEELGVHDVNVTFSNDMTQFSNNDTINVILPLDITVIPSDIPYDDNINYFAYLALAYDEVLKGNIAVYLNGTEYFNKNVADFDENHILKDRYTTYIITPAYLDKAVKPGTYDVVAKYFGDEGWDDIVAAAKVNFTDDNINIEAPDVFKYFSGPERFVVSVKDNGGNPVSNASVNITINGVTYEKQTNANGNCSIGLNLNSGVYEVLTQCGESNVFSKVTINDTVIAKNITKMFKNGTQYTAVFIDSQGEILKNTKVEMNINGVFYYRTTDSKGKVQLNINLNPGEYILTAKNPVTNEQHTSLVTVLPTIVENYNLTKYYKNDSQYTLRILGDDGNPVGAGELVTLNINGVFYNRTTNASGYIKMNINLNPGEYIITAEYKGLRASNLITVLSVLETEDLNMTYMDGSQFKAKVLDGQGNPFAGQTVTFNINGLFYNRTTEADGIAKLNIRLMPGKYIITSTFNGLNAANNVTVKS